MASVRGSPADTVSRRCLLDAVAEVDVREAFDLGADAVVVGTAITDVSWITARFAAARGD